MSHSLFLSASVESRFDEDEPRRKAILYEDLRMKNRENYEVTLTHKSETLLKPSPEKGPTRPKKESELLLQGCVQNLWGWEQLRG